MQNRVNLLTLSFSLLPVMYFLDSSLRVTPADFLTDSMVGQCLYPHICFQAKEECPNPSNQIKGRFTRNDCIYVFAILFLNAREHNHVLP